MENNSKRYLSLMMGMIMFLNPLRGEAFELIDNGFDEPYYSHKIKKSGNFELKLRQIDMGGNDLICFESLYMPKIEESGNEDFTESGELSLEIPSSILSGPNRYYITAIDRDCFNNKPFTTLILPSTITFIDENSFNNLSKLQSLELSENMKFTEINCFNGLESLNQLNLPNSLFTIYQDCFNDGSFSSISWGLSLRHLKAGSFCRNKNLKKAILPPNLFKLGNSCFNDCSSLEIVDIPALVVDCITLTDCFNNCPEIKSITLHSRNPINFSNCFDSVDKSTCILRIPQGTRKKYEQLESWSQFTSIEEFPELDY